NLLAVTDPRSRRPPTSSQRLNAPSEAYSATSDVNAIWTRKVGEFSETTRFGRNDSGISAAPTAKTGRGRRRSRRTASDTPPVATTAPGTATHGDGVKPKRLNEW